jgi:hypothetical protein
MLTTAYYIRLLLGDDRAFTSAYDVAVSQSCNQQHAPETLFEDVNGNDELEVGQTYSYCISAYSRRSINWAQSDPAVSASYQSQSTCTRFQVKWESQLEVTIRLSEAAGRLPAVGVLVSWTSSNGGQSVRTDDNGKVTFYYTNTGVNAAQEYTIRVEKTSSHIDHKFECNGLQCTEQTVKLQPLTFDNKMEFTDVSTEPFQGNVFIDGTQHAELPFGCPLANVQVCLVDHVHHTTLGCSITDAVGYYAIPVAVGLTVYPVVNYANHTFSRIAHDSVRPSQGSISTVDSSGSELNYDYFTIDEDGDWRVPVHFLDTTPSKVRLAVAGGKCNRTLGESTIQFTYDSCASTWSKDVTFNAWQTSVAMPAHKFQVEVLTVDHPTIQIGDTVTDYLTAVGTRTQEVDMTQDEGELRWEYHSEPTISIDISAATTRGPNCTDPVIHRDIETDVIISVSEEYPGQPACTWIEGNITLHNQLGENPEDTAALVQANAVTKETGVLLSKCSETCELDLELSLSSDGSTYHSAKATVRIMTGEPETVASIAGVKYAKPISVSMNTGVYAVTKLVPVIVTGHKLISDKFTMDFPEYFPLLILLVPYVGLFSTASVPTHCI